VVAVDTGAAAKALARRLRDLRRTQWPEAAITQAELAEALSVRKQASIQLISSWERSTNPVVPPEDRLDAIATFFSTARSVRSRPYQVLDESDLTPDESQARQEIRRELLGLRRTAVAQDRSAPVPVGESLVGRGPWHFPDGAPVIIVCAELPDHLQKQLPMSGRTDPDRSELARFVDLDSLFELHGHIRAVNPDAEVRFRSASDLQRDDSTAHLVLLGGVDWNKVTEDTVRITGVPVEQYSDDDDPIRGGFRVKEGENPVSFSPVFEGIQPDRRIVEDIGQFFRARNPLNRARTVTVCNGMYGTGVFGTVRTLTDKVFRDRNADFLARTFGGQDAFSLLFRVRVINQVVVTPDWSAPDTVLHMWSRATP
jgi:transcriptional regulator with XRE-family HTH domain